MNAKTYRTANSTRMHFLPIILLGALICWLSAFPSAQNAQQRQSQKAFSRPATTLIVTKTADTDDGTCDADCSLREAITSALAGDNVSFSPLFSAPQTITLTGNQILVNVSMTITGPGVNLLTVSGGNLSRIFQTSVGTNVTISGMRLTQGLGASIGGGAIRSLGSLTLSNMDIDGNSSPTGGGIRATGGLTMTNSTVRNNIATSSVGGGIMIAGGNFTITNTVVTGNDCPTVNGHGGGIEITGATGTISNSTVTLNDAGNVGGGISVEDGVVTISNTLVSQNTAVQSGGGIVHGRLCTLPTPCSLTVNDSTISDNVMTNPAGGTGGGIYADNLAIVTINRSTISGNNRTGVVLGVETAEIYNSTISGNTGAIAGGVYLTSTVLDLVSNSTITNNTATTPGAASGLQATALATVRSTIVAANVNNTVNPDVVGNFTSFGYNLVGNVGAVAAFNQIGDQTGTSLAPLNPQLEPLANNGGPTFTHRLRTTAPLSPALDNGNSFGLSTDQRGNARTVDFPGAPFFIVGDNTDIGAFEASGPTSAAVTVSGRVLDASRRAVRSARLILTDSAGNSRSFVTGSFGIFAFDNLDAGETYVITVESKRHSFSPTLLGVVDSSIEIEIVPN